MSQARELSELELLILAMLASGCTSGYAMRKQMNRMRGGRWSAESGSVYRVIRRLQSMNLLEETRRAGVPNRERTEYRLTSAGSELARDWIAGPPPRGDLSFIVDPIRTRAYFLSTLEPADRSTAVRGWITESKAFIESLEAEIAKRPATADPFVGVADDNLLRLARARHDWLKATLVEVKKLEE